VRHKFLLLFTTIQGVILSSLNTTAVFRQLCLDWKYYNFDCTKNPTGMPLIFYYSYCTYD